ncbi:hypothetical protein [Kovacikia minuta]|nr:hypothetical protein [Kovacikia minuta]
MIYVLSFSIFPNVKFIPRLNVQQKQQEQPKISLPIDSVNDAIVT